MDKQPEIPLEPCKSSCISGIGYHAESRTLALQFVGGKTYRYADVPAETVTALKESKSAGAFFGKQINGKFKALP